MLKEVELMCYCGRRNKDDDSIEKFANFGNDPNFAKFWTSITGGLSG